MREKDNTAAVNEVMYWVCGDRWNSGSQCWKAGHNSALEGFTLC